MVIKWWFTVYNMTDKTWFVDVLRGVQPYEVDCSIVSISKVAVIDDVVISWVVILIAIRFDCMYACCLTRSEISISSERVCAVVNIFLCWGIR